MPTSAHDSTSPAIAVCIPLYNKQHFIAETMQSVLDQTFKDFELIILDNASTDGSARVVQEFDDPRIVFARNEKTLRPIDNFNKVVSLSRAPLVKVLCADDLIHLDCLQRQFDTMYADPTLAMTTCRQHVIGESGKILARDRVLRTPDLVGQQRREVVVRRLVRHGGNPIGNPGNVLFRRAAFDAAGGFPADTDFFAVEIDLWIRLLEHGGYFGLPETLTSFRLSSGSDSRRLGRSVVQIQRQFIRDVCRRNATIVRRRDRFFSAIRAPMTGVRHRMLLAAATDGSRLRAQFARRIIAVGTPVQKGSSDAEVLG